MLPRIGNGVIFLLLLFFTNVSSRSYSDKNLKQDDLIQPLLVPDGQDKTELTKQRDLLQADNAESRWAQPKHGPQYVTTVYSKSMTLSSREEEQSKEKNSLGKSLSHQNHKQRASLNHGSFLSRLLDSKKGPVVVFLSPGTDTDLNAQQSSESSEDDDNNDEDKEDDEPEPKKYVPPPGENDAYVLYNVLRTTQEDEDLDPKAREEFEKTKAVLRQAFALRCGAKNACEQECPKKKPKCPMNCQKEKKKVRNDCQKQCPRKPSCERKCVAKKEDECEQKVDRCQQKQENKCQSKCQQVYDELDACPKPKKQCGPKCGKTMPPYWLR